MWDKWYFANCPKNKFPEINFRGLACRIALDLNTTNGAFDLVISASLQGLNHSVLHFTVHAIVLQIIYNVVILIYFCGLVNK